MSKKILLVLMLTLGCMSMASAQQFALKTNALYWLTGTPNLGAEIALSKHSTISLTANYNPWTFRGDNKIQHWLVQPEYRYWFTEKFTRFYAGVHFVAGQFEVGGFGLPFNLSNRLQNKYYVGSAVGGGLSLGYNFYLGPRWCLEVMAGAGIMRVSYHTEPVKGPRPTSYKNTVRYLPSPTEVGVSVVYLFNSRK